MRLHYLLLMLVPAFCAPAQVPVQAGRASYASCPPGYKSKTDEHAGFNAHAVEGKKLYADEAEGMPLPTNDWWTDLMHSQFSGALWSLPQMLYTGASGVTVHYPSYWIDNGTEIKSRTSLTVGGRGFTAAEARATAWHDWDVVMTLPGTRAGRSMTVTMGHGMPFTWIETEGIDPEISFSAAPVLSGDASTGICARLGDDCYGIYLPEGAKTVMAEGRLTIDLSSARGEYVVVALLPSAASLGEYARYAYSVPRQTRLSWSYDETRSLLNTVWHVDADNLRRPGEFAPVMQGFLPHAYKHWANGPALDGAEYMSPRGMLRMAAVSTSTDNTWTYAYRFTGILPYYAVPGVDASVANPYRPEIMRGLMQKYAASGTFGDDTYWGGKGLVQMALNMTFARETGDEESYRLSRDKLRGALVDWLTYTPGENTKFFAYYPRWGSLVGYDVSYDSDAFNDHHFHYGYFIYAAALLCLEDKEFAADYGEMLTMIAKDYANYDRNDARFPFLRTLDPFAGHSYAGGNGDHLNDNGNGQESSSEAMQSWGGVYLLGVALGDREMRDAGIFGWMTESRATAEYWFDRDHIHPGHQHNYDYTKYASPWCTNLTSKGIGWWTWFSGDALWMHSIQWMPVSPMLGYLSEDLEFAKWDVETMMGSTGYKWFEKTTEGDALADQSVGNVVLCYLERSDPDEAASIFDRAIEGDFGIYRNVDTGHISYYVIHNHRTYGEIDRDVTADIPTANCYVKPDGSRTYIVYNSDDTERRVTFYRNGVAERTVTAAPRCMTPFTADPRPDRIAVRPAEGTVLPPGDATRLSAIVYDQYGVTVPGASVSYAISPASAATVADGMLTVSASAVRGSRYTLTATSGNLTETVEFEVNDRPAADHCAISPSIDYVEQGRQLTFALDIIDQYGKPMEADAVWTIADLNRGTSVKGASLEDARPGKYRVTAVIGDREVNHDFVVTPALPNIAFGCPVTESSHENVGCLPENLTDGDHGTRWGSEHSDDQWVCVDLGEPSYVSRVWIDWEAAHATEYAIEFSADGDEWTEVCHPTSVTTPRSDMQSIDAVCPRYIRIRGISRATAYGYSIYELEVYGFALSADRDEVLGFDITAPAWMDQGSVGELSATAYTLGGDTRDIDVDWSCSHDARFEGNRFTPLAYGNVTVTATARSLSRAAAMSSTKSIFVNEATRLASLSLSPAEATVLHGETIALTLDGLNQYGGIHAVDTDNVDWTVTDASGRDIEPSKVLADMTFAPLEAGTYTVTANYGGLNRSATLTAESIDRANLALRRPVTATSVRDNNYASHINDGLMDTRWESEWQQDPQTVTIDLESPFNLNRMEIAWEGAYAKHYTVETSLDGHSWQQVYEHSGSLPDGLTDSFAIKETPARYVRLNCLARELDAYGNSAHEWRVYGTSRYNDLTGVTDVTVGVAAPQGVYTVDGRLLRHTNDTTGLATGLYIVGNKTVFIP
ncbi:MAG: discoidin domain-containing protein [Bacteroidales bacterium]|nr:discoidin domain-containing protein [Bacteroidales bacterium]